MQTEACDKGCVSPGQGPAGASNKEEQQERARSGSSGKEVTAGGHCDKGSSGPFASTEELRRVAS
eukprot:4273400-Lingulodinium_polyedra.AAC.1